MDRLKFFLFFSIKEKKTKILDLFMRNKISHFLIFIYHLKKKFIKIKEYRKNSKIIPRFFPVFE